MRLIDNIAPPFSSTATYNRGDKVINDNMLYECSVDNYTPGVFSEDNFKKAYLCDMVGAGSNTGSSDIDYIAPLFDSEKEYMKDDAVIYDGLLYICNEDNVTGEFDVSKWTKKSLIEVGDLNSNLGSDLICNVVYRQDYNSSNTANKSFTTVNNGIYLITVFRYQGNGDQDSGITINSGGTILSESGQDYLTPSSKAKPFSQTVIKATSSSVSITVKNWTLDSYTIVTRIK